MQMLRNSNMKSSLQRFKPFTNRGYEQKVIYRRWQQNLPHHEKKDFWGSRFDSEPSVTVALSPI